MFVCSFSEEGVAVESWRETVASGLSLGPVEPLRTWKHGTDYTPTRSCGIRGNSYFGNPK